MNRLRLRSVTSIVCPAPLVVVASLLAMGGCKSTPPATPPPPSDNTLTQAVGSKLSSDAALSGEPIQSSVQQGIATLNGTVSSSAARSLAADDVAQVTGIRTVINNLVVQQPVADALAPAPAVRSSRAEKALPRQKPSAVVAPPDAIAAPVASPPTAVAEVSPAPIERAVPPAPATPVAPAARPITLPTHTALSVRITQALDSATTQAGDTFSGVLASDVVSEGVVILPQGTPVKGKVDTVQEAAHFKGNSLLTIELTSLDRRGATLPIVTDSYSKAGKGRGKNSAEKVGGGAAIGAILGGIFGGGAGAAIGAAAGGGAGAGVQAITKGQQVQIDSETILRFHLAKPVILPVVPNGRSRGDAAGVLQHHN